LAYDWGQASVLYPSSLLPTQNSGRDEREQPPVWDSPPVQSGQPLPGDVLSPPLLQELDIAPDAPPAT
jgi:hypothetical protein